MGYVAPRTWTPGEYPTAAQLNQDLRDNVAFLANPPACRVRRTTNQTLTTGVEATVTFDAERYDTGSMHDNVTNSSRITINTAGLYLVTFVGSFPTNGTGYRYFFIRLNGATPIASESKDSASIATGVDFSLATVYKFAVADYIEVRAFQNSGGNLDITSASAHTPEFSATWIGLG